MPKKKIAIIWHAGVTKEYQKLASSIAELALDWEIHLITPSAWPEGGKGKTRNHSSHQKNFYVHAELVLGNGMSKHFYPRLGSLLASIQPDLLDMIEEPSSLVAWQIRSYAIKRNIPFIFNSAQIKMNEPSWLLKKIESLFLQDCHGAICRNPRTATVFKEKGFNGPTTFIGNGVDLKGFHPNVKPIDLFTDQDHVVGFVGKFNKNKGILPFLDTFIHHSIQHPHWKLLLIGDGELDKQVKEKITPYKKSIYYSGFIENQDLPPYLARLSLLVMPSLKTKEWEEPFGRVAIEAMAMGVPVLGSNSGFIPSLIQNDNYIFPANDWEKLEEKFESLTTSKTNKKKWVEKAKPYDWKSLAKERFKFYQSLLKAVT